MDQIGYSLVDEGGNELQVFGDTYGRCDGAPDMIILPSGDQVHCPAVGDVYSGFRLVPRFIVEAPENSVIFNGVSVIVSRPNLELPKPSAEQILAQIAQLQQELAALQPA